MKKHIAIIGGGITGLSAAYQLKASAKQQKLELACTVIERDRQFGGKVRTHREGGFIMEEGPDSILARKPAGVGLIKSLGLESELVSSNPAAMKTFILHRGALASMPPGTNMGIPAQWQSFAQTNLVSFGGKLRALFDLVLPKSAPASDIPLGPFLRRRLGDEVVNHMIEPLLAGIYAGSVDELSLRATFPQFLELEQANRSLILGSMRQRRKAPRPAPSHGRSAFVTLSSGLQAMIERLYDELHVWADLRVGASVEQIRKTEHGAYELTVQSDTGTETVTADAVVLAAPTFAAARLLSPLSPTAGQLTAINYVSTATILLAYPCDRVPAHLEGSGFVVPRTENRGITACTLTSNKWPHTTPEDQVLIRCYVGRAGQQEALQGSDDDIIQLVRQELQDILGISAPPWFAKVTRWNQAMPQYHVHHNELVADVIRALDHDAPGVYLAGAGYHGVGVPDCIADGTAGAKRALAHLFA